MQKILLLLFIVFAGCLYPLAQEVPNEIFPPEKIITKGTLYYFDGRKESFSGLQFRNKEVLFTDSEGNIHLKPLNDIEHIDQRVNQAGKGAIIGGAAGILIGYSAGRLIYGDGVFFSANKNEDGSANEIKRKEFLFVAACTLGGAVAGALAGMKSKKETTIYRRFSNVEVFPGISSLPSEQNVLSVHFRMQL